MALIKCPECGAEVSDKAEKCPHCSYPIAQESEAEKIQTIEMTSKKLKSQILVSSFVIIFGVILLIAGNILIAFILLPIGLIWLIVASIMRWWHHG